MNQPHLRIYKRKSSLNDRAILHLICSFYTFTLLSDGSLCNTRRGPWRRCDVQQMSGAEMVTLNFDFVLRGTQSYRLDFHGRPARLVTTRELTWISTSPSELLIWIISVGCTLTSAGVLPPPLQGRRPFVRLGFCDRVFHAPPIHLEPVR